MLRYRVGHYQLLEVQTNTFAGQLSDDIGKWTTWKAQFILATTGGYVNLYRNGVLLVSAKGNTSGGNNSYLKQGIYSQEMNPPGIMTTYTRNLVLTSNSVKNSKTTFNF